MELTAIVTVLALLQYQYFAYRAGAGRAKYGVAAPATTGDATFERVFRVHQNTLEQLMTFLPGLWLFSYFVDEPFGAAVGFVFLVARVAYSGSYVKEPERRTPGFVTGFLAQMVLILGGLVGAIRSLL